MPKTLIEVFQPATVPDPSVDRSNESTLTTSLSYSAIEVEMSEFCPAEFDFPSFLQEILNLCQTRAERKGIAFTYHKSDQLPTIVRADRQQLWNILEHLLNWAIQIPGAGCVTFTVEILHSEGLGKSSQLRIQVEVEEVLEPEFIEFGFPNQLSPHGQPWEIEQSTFIQCQIQAMGSTLHTQNLPGVGCLVWMDLTFPAPCHLPPPKSCTDLDSDNPVLECHSDRPPPLRILVAEDIPVNQKLALRILKRLGYKADLATNGVEVLHALDRQFYDVVFMDIQMPQMDGLEATRRIRQELPHDHYPWIIALTANATRGDRETCLAVGMNDYLSKPIDIEALAKALRQCPVACRSNVAHQAKI